MDKIVCFGKNYYEHMHELGDAPVDKPVIFVKPASVLRQCSNWGEALELSIGSEETHFECELVLRLGTGGYQLNYDNAAKAIDAFSVGLDMTLRDKQAQLKKAGHPWTTAKVFPDSAVIGPWITGDIANLLDYEFSFSLNGKQKQLAKVNQMIFKPVELIVYASQFFPLCPGDILFTGTPKGVGSVSGGDSGKLDIAGNSYIVNWKKY